MTPRQETNLERAVGRIEGQMEALTAAMTTFSATVTTKLDAADEWRREVKSRLESVEDHGKHMSLVAEAFNALQASIRDSKMQARGFVIGISVAAGSAGAAITSFIKWFFGIGI
jgi:reverse gyrase